MPDDELDETNGGTAAPPSGGTAPTGKRRGRPPGAKTGTGTRGRPPKARIERRSAKAAEAIRELVRLRMPELDVSDLTFAKTVDRDADAWGDFLAQVGEWVPPFGEFLDLVVGAALVRVLRIAPSLRAARRDLAERRERRAARLAELRAEEERNAAVAAGTERAAAGFEPEAPGAGVFGDAPAGMSREDWLASGGNGAGFAPHGHGAGVYEHDGGAAE